jgi:hypothetical protein
MLIVIGAGFYYGGIHLPMQFNFYSPPAAWWHNIRDAPEAAPAPEAPSAVQVYGRVYWDNMTLASFIEIRIFATDELFEEIVPTDEFGVFYSTNAYDTGQIVTLWYGEYRLYGNDFIYYDAVSPFYLGEFVIPI